MDDTRGSALLAVRVNRMRLEDKWVCDSSASHHMIGNKQYLATHKRFLAPVNISLADKGTILACGSGRINIEMLVESKWCPGYLEDMWYTPNIRRHLFLVWSVAKHKLVSSQNVNELCFNVTVSSWQQAGV